MTISRGDLVAFRSSLKAILSLINIDVDDLTQADLDLAVEEVKAMLRVCEENTIN